MRDTVLFGCLIVADPRRNQTGSFHVNGACSDVVASVGGGRECRSEMGRRAIGSEGVCGCVCRLRASSASRLVAAPPVPLLPLASLSVGVKTGRGG